MLINLQKNATLVIAIKKLLCWRPVCGARVPSRTAQRGILAPEEESTDQQSVTTGHEMFGHGIPFANGASPEQNNTNAVQTDNLIRKVLGMPPMDPNAVQRHVGATNPTALPSMVDKQ